MNSSDGIAWSPVNRALASTMMSTDIGTKFAFERENLPRACVLAMQGTHKRGLSLGLEVYADLHSIQASH